MHNAAFSELGLDMCYIPFKVSPDDLPDAVKSIRSLNLTGVNITVPHKENVIPLLDRVDEEAAFIGAVNTITNHEGTLTGYNTDGRGFMNSLAEETVSVENRDVVMIGTGGAARAVSYYLSEKASKLSMFDIDRNKADALVSDLSRIRNNVSVLDSPDEIGSPDVLINATPLGLHADDLISSDMVVCDLIYRKTPLLINASEKGAKTVDGSGMLLWQGVLAFELWTGVKPPVDTMRHELLSRIR
jgi:shikimate dehydrogenase